MVLPRLAELVTPSLDRGPPHIAGGEPTGQRGGDAEQRPAAAQGAAPYHRCA